MIVYIRSLICLVFLLHIVIADVINVPADQTTIQLGIVAADDGDTVIVAAGTYTGSGNKNIDFYGKSIYVTSESGFSELQIICVRSCVIGSRLQMVFVGIKQLQFIQYSLCRRFVIRYPISNQPLDVENGLSHFLHKLNYI